MDIQRLLNASPPGPQGSRHLATPPSFGPPVVGSSHGDSSSSSAGGRMGKERVLRPCSSCGSKNHIRSTHCTKCGTQLRAHARSSSSQAGSSGRSSSSSPHSSQGDSSSRRGGHDSMPHSGPPSTLSPPSSHAYQSSGHHGSSASHPHGSAAHYHSGHPGGPSSGAPRGSVPPGVLPPPSSMGSATSVSGSGHGSSGKRRPPGLPLSAGPGTLPSKHAPGASSSSPSRHGSSSDHAQGLSDRTKRVMRPCTTCGAQNHIRTGTCKTCSNPIVNMGRQGRRGTTG